jgi:uncharacterized membrane protein YfcA
VLLALALAAAVVGCLIGGTGVGGVLLPPALIYLGGLDAHAAAATSMASYLVLGAAGTLAYLRRGSVRAETALPAAVGAVPGALAGTWLNTMLPAGVLHRLLALLILANVPLLLLRRPEREGTAIPWGWLLAIGAVVGCGSSLSGTSGPVLLIPALTLLRAPPLAAVSASQVIQVPIASAGTLGYAIHGNVHLGLGLALGVLGTAGVFGGAKIAHSIAPATLRLTVGIGLLLTGIAMAVAG